MRSLVLLLAATVPAFAADPQAGRVVRNGADDNASGTAAVLELARRLQARPARRSPQPGGASATTRRIVPPSISSPTFRAQAPGGNHASSRSSRIALPSALAPCNWTARPPRCTVGCDA